MQYVTRVCHCSTRFEDIVVHGVLRPHTKFGSNTFNHSWFNGVSWYLWYGFFRLPEHTYRPRNGGAPTTVWQIRLVTRFCGDQICNFEIIALLSLQQFGLKWILTPQNVTPYMGSNVDGIPRAHPRVISRRTTYCWAWYLIGLHHSGNMVCINKHWRWRPPPCWILPEYNAHEKWCRMVS